MNKKTKFATALLATALLSNGFTLDTKEEATSPEPEHTAEVVEEQESKPANIPLNMVPEEEIEVEVFEEDFNQPENETPQPLPTENEPVPTTSPQQASTLTQKQADTKEVLPTVSLSESTSENQITPEEVCDTPINLPEVDTMNGIDYGSSQTIQPDVTKTTYTEEQLTDPTQKPDGSPVDSPTVTQTYEQTATPTPTQADDFYWQIQNGTYQFNGDEVIYTERSIIYITFPPENQEPVYIPGFGWVEPSGEPSIRVQALDMYESGVKVGTMGGG